MSVLSRLQAGRISLRRRRPRALIVLAAVAVLCTGLAAGAAIRTQAPGKGPSRSTGTFEKELRAAGAALPSARRNALAVLALAVDHHPDGAPIFAPTGTPDLRLSVQWAIGLDAYPERAQVEAVYGELWSALWATGYTGPAAANALSTLTVTLRDRGATIDAGTSDGIMHLAQVLKKRADLRQLYTPGDILQVRPLLHWLADPAVPAPADPDSADICAAKRDLRTAVRRVTGERVAGCGLTP